MRARWDKLQFTASEQAARLYKLHGESCPPDYDPDQRYGAAPDSLFMRMSEAKLLEAN